MSTSKVILVGAISVVFGLYNLSLMKVNGSAGRSAEIAAYQARAADNARAGVQKVLNAYNFTPYIFPTSAGSVITSNYTFMTDSVVGTEKSYYSYTTRGVLVGSTYQLSIGSHGFYRSPTEPVTFSGHEVVDTAYAEFPTSYTLVGYGAYAYWNIKLKSQYVYINYTAEHILDSLQGGKNNLLGY